MGGKLHSVIHGLRCGCGRRGSVQVPLFGCGNTRSEFSTRCFPHQLLCGRLPRNDKAVQQANQQSLRLMQEEWVILRSVPGAVDRAAQPLLPVASEPVAPPCEGGGPVPEYSATRSTDRASASWAGVWGEETVHEGLRDVASVP